MAAHQVSGVTLHQCEQCPSVWLGALEREALWQNLPVGHRDEFAQFVPENGAPSVRCPSCSHGRLQAGRIGQRELMCCASCGGILVSFKWRDVVDQNETWRKVLSVVVDLLPLLP